MIDLSKIRIGDEVTVRAKVIDIHVKDKDLPLRIDASGVGLWVRREDILAHHPKPREFKPGDFVCELGIEPGFRVVHVRDDHAWIDNQSGWQKIARLIHLRHADESE